MPAALTPRHDPSSAERSNSTVTTVVSVASLADDRMVWRIDELPDIQAYILLHGEQLLRVLNDNEAA